jgi:hypothetical protein
MLRAVCILLLAAALSEAARLHLRGQGEGEGQSEASAGAVAVVAHQEQLSAADYAKLSPLGKWLQRQFPQLTRGALFKLDKKLNGQNLYTIDDVTKLGYDGINALHVSPAIRTRMREEVIVNVGQKSGAEDGAPVFVKPYKKPPPPSKCKTESEVQRDFYKNLPVIDPIQESIDAGKPLPQQKPRFAVIRGSAGTEVFGAQTAGSDSNSNRWNQIGDYLRRTYPKLPPTKIERAVAVLKRDRLTTLADLAKIGVAGVEKLHVPPGIRPLLRDAIIYYIGLGGYDDGGFVAYQPPKGKKDNRVFAIAVPHKKTACERERERKTEEAGKMVLPD